MSDMYIVEKILKNRTRKVPGRTGTIKEYLVKWQGYNSDENTWEPRKNLKKGTIDEFEQQKQLEKFKNVAEIKATTSKVAKVETRPRRRGKSGWKIKMKSILPKNKSSFRSSPIIEPDEVIDSKKDCDGVWQMLFKWKGSSETSFVPLEEAKIKYPQTIIRYFERITVFYNKPIIPLRRSEI